ncbi:hypothetical protein LOK49_Contig111G00005 [Camellia lanceoleosa]|nr:hypothetical protein LOK49_Contig111G00005 [Camellia lanceoleosa]
MSEGGKERGVASADPSQPHYGIFQGVSNYPPPSHPQPAIGFPQPVPPPGASVPYANAYQAFPGSISLSLFLSLSLSLTIAVCVCVFDLSQSTMY